MKQQFCKTCNDYVSVLAKPSGPHTKLICVHCGKYIKFASSKDLADNPDDALVDDDILNRIEFKLDLIIDHLGIKA